MQLSYFDVVNFIKEANLSDLKNFKLISKGIDTTTFLIVTKFQKYILTLYESKKLPFEMRSLLTVTTEFTNQGIPLPKILFSGKIRGSDVILTSFSNGKTKNHWDAEDYYQVGFLIGNWHRISNGMTSSFLSSRSILDVSKDLTALEKVIPKEFSHLGNELEKITANFPYFLPKGVIHGDLWYKSFLFENDMPSAILDFSRPSQDLFILDLASLIKGIFFSSELEDKELAYNSFLMGYEIARPLLQEEIASLNLMVSFKILSTITCMLKLASEHEEKRREFETTALLNLFKYEEAKELDFIKMKTTIF